jgi:methionyl-tRNA formyltransferase
MRVVFAGTPEFARVALDRLHTAGFEIVLVLTQPDRPAGRGLKPHASSVKQWAEERDVAVVQPRSLRVDGKYPEDAIAARTALEEARADVMIVAAYGLILPQWVLDMLRGRPGEAAVPGSTDSAKLGCLNIHASLLPRWRGAAPIHRAIEAGDAETGVTIMQMDAGLDTGDMLLSEAVPITATDSTGSLHDTLAALGGRLIVEALELAARGGLKPQPQPLEGVNYAQKISKHEAQVDWLQAATVIERRIRAFSPLPVASSEAGTVAVKFHQACVAAREVPAGTVPGQVLAAGSAGVDIATGDGVLRVLRLQKPGGRELAAADFLRGFPLEAGMIFGAPR